MRIIFLGTPEFAVATLKALVEHGRNVVAVVTAPDRPAGRGQQMHESAVKTFAVKKNIPVLQPEKLKDEEFLKQLKSFQADLQIVVAFRMLPEVVWNMPPLGTYNLHASLLPNYRGAAPINWAVINGEQTTGITTFKLKHEIDSGNILFHKAVKIEEDDTAGTLHDKLMVEGAALMLKTVDAIEKAGNSPLPFIEQKSEEVTHAPKLYKETGSIDWSAPALTIHNLVRGLSPVPGAHAKLVSDAGTIKSLKIFRTKVISEEAALANGSLVTDNKTFLRVRCGKGMIELLDVQLEGKKRMDVRTFLLGQRLSDCKLA